MVERLGPSALLAVLAHEAAHVMLGHTRRKLVWGVCVAAAGIVSATVLQIVLAPHVPRVMAFAGALLVILPLGVVRHLFDLFVVRRHEREADGIAVDVAGGAACLDALGAIAADMPRMPRVHHRWTTHGTRERREAWIRARQP